MFLVTPENIAGVLTAIGAIIAAIGGVTFYRAKQEPPKPGSPDAALLALAENTKALNAQSAQFRDNNKLFEDVLSRVDGMAKDFAAVKHDMADAKSHLGAIRDILNRRG